MSELLSMWNHQVILGIAQAAAAVALCLAVVFLCRRFAVHVERETAFSLARGFLQMVAVGVLLAALLHGSLPIAICILVGMTFAAAVTAARRAPGISRPRLLSFCAIAAGGGIAIAVMLATGTLTSDLIVLVPVGSMLIANAMNACAQAMERFRADVMAHVGQIEAGLSLGADPATTVAPYVQSAVYASLLPRRHSGVRRQSCLRGYFSVHHRRDDLIRVGDSRTRRHFAYAGAGLFERRPIGVSSRYSRLRRAGEAGPGPPQRLTR